MVLRNGWLAPAGQTRLDTRHTALGATTPAGPFASRSGILPGTYDGKYRVGGLWMSSNGPMSATVYHGRAVIQGPEAQGAYPVALDADTVITFADGDPLNPRVDLVVLRVYDDQFDGSTRSEAALEIVRGTPAATPVAPNAPALSLTLFSVRVPAGTSAGTGGIPWTTTGTVTDLRVTVAGVGGILPVYNNGAEPGAYPGQYQDNDNAHFLQRWNGTAWVAYPKEIGGIAPSGSLSTGSYAGQFRENNGVLQRWNGTTWTAYQPPVEVESAAGGLTAPAGWSVSQFAGRKTKGGLCTITAVVTRSGGTLTSDSQGNIPDEPLCTLPVGWRPAITVEAPASDGYASGGAVISYNGQIDLRTWFPNAQLIAGRSVRVSATYILL
ncbi:hypothetical protein AB0K02_07410 [Streptomyces sp. NPDC049597]|uniref:hypothetical protein n=1 Tax=Streptomyces sp. NPDC049597 TaxID=3155276 RepID=UPI003437F7C1